MEKYTCTYASPIGPLVLTGDGEALTGLDFAAGLGATEPTTPALREAKEWLDIYFSGIAPDFMPPLHLHTTPFRALVCEIMQSIPYGHTVTYGEIARLAAARLGKDRMSAQAVGGAVGHNPIAILIPCHRVVGTGGSLTGYAGGIDRKRTLLELERVDMSRLFIPKRGTKR